MQYKHPLRLVKPSSRHFRQHVVEGYYYIPLIAILAYHHGNTVVHTIPVIEIIYMHIGQRPSVFLCMNYVIKQ